MNSAVRLDRFQWIKHGLRMVFVNACSRVSARQSVQQSVPGGRYRTQRIGQVDLGGLAVDLLLLSLGLGC